MAIALLAQTLIALSATDSLMGPGVSLELARYRAERISDVRYDLSFDFGNRDTASGSVRVRFKHRGVSDVILDFRGLSLDVRDVNGTRSPRTEYNGAHLWIPAAMVRDGDNALSISFKTPIAPSGAAIIRFTDETDKRDYLYTLLVPSDANLLFPCFDQPDLKAVFSLSGYLPDHTALLTNSELSSVGEVAVPGSRTSHDQWVYGSTKPISTYLFAFAVGPYAALRKASAIGTPGVHDTRVWVRQSRAREAETDSIIAMNERAKDWLAAYFGIPYPFGKLDYLLAPAFPFGGMEHPGAIFYNEESFIFREPPTLVQRLGRQATINHEVAHQWFGDYTTMKWFDDLWMKEGFATYMSAKMQHAMSDSTAWMSFYLRNKPTAYDVDVTAGTTPVWQELRNLDQAKSNYGAIVYNKAPAVLKQLNHLVGDSAFRIGVSAFLKTHAYGNATWRELLASIGKAAGRDLTSWGQAYFLRPGMPVIEQRLTLGPDGRVTRLALIQRPAQPLSGPGVWPMKVDVLLRLGTTGDRTISVEMKAETTLVNEAVGLPNPAMIYANANDYGYGLVMLDSGSVEYLLGDPARYNAVEPALSAMAGRASASKTFLRAMLWGSLWDLVREARLPPRRFVDGVLTHILTETDEQIASRLLGRLSTASARYLPSDPQLTARIEATLLRGASDSTKSYSLRKSFFDTYVGVARSRDALARLDTWLDSGRVVGELLRQPTRWSIVTQLVARDWPTAGTRLTAETTRDTSTGGRRRAFIAAAARPSAVVKRAYFDRYFRDSTLNEDWVTASVGAFNDLEQSAVTLQYLRPALDTLQWVQKNRRIFFLGRWLDAFIGGHRSAGALAIVDRFLEENPGLPKDLRQKVLQTRDDLERTVRIRAAFSASPTP
jgi:aminopeptidase N